MHNVTRLVRSALIVVLLTACASTPPTLESVAGIWGRSPAAFAGSTLLLRSDSTYSLCNFSDTPQFDGKFFEETHGSYRIDEHQLKFRGEIPAKWANKYVVKLRGKVHMITEEQYLNHRDDERVIREYGLVAELPTADKPYVCGD